jgi:hypothetical protein
VSNHPTTIAFGRLAVDRDPSYVEAAFDFALLLEEKVQASGPTASSVGELKAVYQRLETLVEDRMKADRGSFTERDRAYVRERLSVWRDYVISSTA